MDNTSVTPGLADLYRLGEQVEGDKLASVQTLRQRDHAIGLRCTATDDVARLTYWLHNVTDSGASSQRLAQSWLTEASAAFVARLVAAVLGFMSMATFLWSGGQGLVNVFIFLLLFVLVQIVFCLASALVMAGSIRGNAPAVLPINPARLVVSRVFPDKRYLRESQSVVRLLLLRYGQEFGAIFTLGAVAAFFVVLAFSDFTFVWGSTFAVSDDFVRGLTSSLAAPWSAWLPSATVSPQLIAESRYHPALTDLSQANIVSMRGWWPFLIMAMLSYALLPRIILWGLSRLFYVKLMRTSFTRYPGAQGIFARMKSPVVNTQALEPEAGAGHVAAALVPLDEGLMLLNWAGALVPDDLGRFDEVRAVPSANVMAAGLGSLDEDKQCTDRINEYGPERLLVAVKAWEPPMADLRDLLDSLQRVTHCTLYLVPLPHRAVAEQNLQEWRAFTRDLPYAVADLQALERS